jgi:hypothetical protein
MVLKGGLGLGAPVKRMITDRRRVQHAFSNRCPHLASRHILSLLIAIPARSGAFGLRQVSTRRTCCP